MKPCVTEDAAIWADYDHYRVNNTESYKTLEKAEMRYAQLDVAERFAEITFLPAGNPLSQVVKSNLARIAELQNKRASERIAKSMGYTLEQWETLCAEASKMQ